MRVDKNIADAISKYIAERKITQKILAAELGVSETAMVKWHMPGCGITDKNWEKLFVRIRKYLPQERIYVTGGGRPEYSSLTEKKKNLFDVLVHIPELKAGDLIRYTPVVGIEQFAREENLGCVEYCPKVAGVGGLFCHVLKTASAGVPKNARLFASSEAKPKNGRPVLAVTAGKEIVFGMYRATGRTFELNTGEKKLTGKLEDIRTMFTGFFPVISYEVVCY